MNTTVFFTIFAGVLTYVLGQLVVKLLIDPVQEFKKTIGAISHALIDRANIILNPGCATPERMSETSLELRKLSSQLHAHLYLIPQYPRIAPIFRLPARESVVEAATALIGLSNGVFEARQIQIEANEKRVEKICQCLGIYRP
jgi:hypothetical protein